MRAAVKTAWRLTVALRPGSMQLCAALRRFRRPGHPVIADLCYAGSVCFRDHWRSTDMPEQSCYVGLDVYLEQTSICVVNDAGAVVWRGKSPSTEDGIPPWLASMHAVSFELD